MAVRQAVAIVSRGLVWHSAHSYALGQRGLVVVLVGLVTSGQEWRTLNSVAFGCIWLHFLSSEPSPWPSPRGRGDLHGAECEVPAFAGTTGCLCVNDACDQCTGWRGYGAMGSCRWVGAWGSEGAGKENRTPHSARWSCERSLSSPHIVNLQGSYAKFLRREKGWDGNAPP